MNPAIKPVTMAPRAPSTITVLHLAVEWNTPQRVKTTTAVEWLVDAIDDFDNVVIAYRRVPRRVAGTETVVSLAPVRVYDFPYFGLPLGIGLHSAMRDAARRTIKQLELDGIRPAVVHAHKLTFEGIAGWYIAQHFGVPLMLSLRGEVETKVFRYKPILRRFLQRMCRDAARLYIVSAWFADEFHRHVPDVAARERMLPNIVRNIEPVIESQPPGETFVSIFNLNMWRRKGASWLLAGFADAARQDATLKLDIIGRGTDRARAAVRRIITRHKLEDRVRLVGEMSNAELLAALPRYRGLLLPSVNETFGMVYVEALFAGIPILFTRGTAIDGYVDGLSAAKTVPPRDVRAITRAILEIARDGAILRADLAAAAPRLFAAFDPVSATARYRADLLELAGVE